MTKEELQAASFLLNIANAASDRAYGICPDRPDKPGSYGSSNSVDRRLVEIGRLASDAFYELTGRSVYDVRWHELNTLTPADWTKKARKNGLTMFDRTSKTT